MYNCHTRRAGCVRAGALCVLSDPREAALPCGRARAGRCDLQGPRVAASRRVVVERTGRRWLAGGHGLLASGLQRRRVSRSLAPRPLFPCYRLKRKRARGRWVHKVGSITVRHPRHACEAWRQPAQPLARRVRLDPVGMQWQQAASRPDSEARRTARRICRYRNTSALYNVRLPPPAPRQPPLPLPHTAARQTYRALRPTAGPRGAPLSHPTRVGKLTTHAAPCVGVRPAPRTRHAGRPAN